MNLPEKLTTEELRKAFLERIERHDYSYDYSDDGRVYDRGLRSLNTLREQVKALIKDHKVDAQELYEAAIKARPEQFKDNLCHRVINLLFTSYAKIDTVE